MTNYNTGNPILHLGVLDFPHEEPTPPTKVAKKHTKPTATKSQALISTGDLAEILEAKYHIMESFFEANRPAILKELEGSYAVALENLFSGGSVSNNPTLRAGDGIKKMFTDFIQNDGLSRLGYPGTPTAASGKTSKREGGIDHRLLHPYSKNNPSRPSFVDTGVYEAAFKAWLE